MTQRLFFKKNLLPLVYGKWGLGGDRKIFLRVAKTGETERPDPSFFSRPPADDDGCFADTTHALCFPRRFSKKKWCTIPFFLEKKGKRLWVRTFLVPCLSLSSFTVQCKTRRKTFPPSKVLSKTHFPIFLFGENVRNQWAALTPFLRSHGWALKAFIRGWREGITKSSFLSRSCPHFAQRQQKGIEVFFEEMDWVSWPETWMMLLA